MKITSEKLRQIIKEELSHVLYEKEQEEDRIQKLARYIQNGDRGALMHGLELIEIAELEPWHRTDLYQAIKSHADEMKKEMELESEQIYYYRNVLAGRQDNKYMQSLNKIESELGELIQKTDGLRSQLNLVELVLSKFETDSMVYVDDPTME